MTHLYGPAVASLYSFHSFRSGLATALHAAGVPDAMIQLICRWMCPESLHVYRRMGVAENEINVRRASTCHVDCTQSVNVPIVVGDQHMAALASEFGQARATAEQQSYEQALRAAMDPYPPQKLPRANDPAHPTPKAHSRAPRPNAAGHPITLDDIGKYYLIVNSCKVYQ